MGVHGGAVLSAAFGVDDREGRCFPCDCVRGTGKRGGGLGQEVGIGVVGGWAALLGWPGCLPQRVFFSLFFV